MSFSVLFLAFLSLAAIVTIPVSLQRSLQATSSSIGIQKADAAGEIVAANDSLQLGRTSLGAADVNCSSGTVGSAYCENSQNSNSAFTSSTPSWTNITSTTGPSPRWGASMAYDAADGYVVLFGGQSIFGYNANLHDTWKFVGGSWTNITTSSGPQADAYAPMTFDAAEGYIVMFSRFGSTWIFQAGAWSLATPCSLPCSPLPSPSPRVAASMTYDPIAGVVVLFGGCCRSPTQDVYGDTWEFQCKLFACGWTNVTSDTGPPARLFASMEYDAADGYTVLFGGTTTFTSTLPFTSLGDTWKFTGGSWTNITATVGPSPRIQSTMAYDAAGGYLVLFGGFTGELTIHPPLADTWEFLGGWTSVTTTSSPPAGSSAAMTYDAADGYTLLFGGVGVRGPLGDTWNFSGPGIPPAFNYTISNPFPSDLTMPQGSFSCSCYPIAATLTGGAPALVTFSISSPLPTGVTITFSHSTCYPTCIVGVSLKANATAALGTSDVIVQAAGGGVTETISFSLTIVQPFTFTLRAFPTGLTVTQGSTSGSTSITATLVTGSPDEVGFIVTSSTLPVGITQLSTNDPCTPNPFCTVTISFAATDSAPTGTYALTILAMGRSPPQRVQLTLTVVPPALVSCGHDVHCSVVSNATLSNIKFAGNTIHFEADGPPGAHGYSNVTIPKSSIPRLDQLRVFVDNSELTSSAVIMTSNSTAYFIYFTFTFHSPALIDIQLTTPEPAPKAPAILGLDPTQFYLLAGALAAVIIVTVSIAALRKRQ